MRAMSEPFSWPFRLAVSVRFRDLDSYGHVNNAVFATYFEQARCECYLTLTGQNDPNQAVDGLHFVVARTEIDHLAPIIHGDALTIDVFPTKVGRSSFVFSYEARTERSGVVARGLTVCVAYDHDKKSSRPIDAQLAADLRAGLPAETT
jgi:acyl-CoA thioester hydrolase